MIYLLCREIRPLNLGFVTVVDVIIVYLSK